MGLLDLLQRQAGQQGGSLLAGQSTPGNEQRRRDYQLYVLECEALGKTPVSIAEFVAGKR